VQIPLEFGLLFFMLILGEGLLRKYLVFFGEVIAFYFRI
jgi:hypothetical protein